VAVELEQCGYGRRTDHRLRVAYHDVTGNEARLGCQCPNAKGSGARALRYLQTGGSLAALVGLSRERILVIDLDCHKLIGIESGCLKLLGVSVFIGTHVRAQGCDSCETGLRG